MNFYIWSVEHKGFWKSHGYGYTNDMALAGRFGLHAAIEICNNANEYYQDIHEVMIPVQ